MSSRPALAANGRETKERETRKQYQIQTDERPKNGVGYLTINPNETEILLSHFIRKIRPIVRKSQEILTKRWG